MELGRPITEAIRVAGLALRSLVTEQKRPPKPSVGTNRAGAGRRPIWAPLCAKQPAAGARGILGSLRPAAITGFAGPKPLLSQAFGLPVDGGPWRSVPSLEGDSVARGVVRALFTGAVPKLTTAPRPARETKDRAWVAVLRLSLTSVMGTRSGWTVSEMRGGVCSTSQHLSEPTRPSLQGTRALLEFRLASQSSGHN